MLTAAKNISEFSNNKNTWGSVHSFFIIIININIFLFFSPPGMLCSVDGGRNASRGTSELFRLIFAVFILGIVCHYG